MEYLTRVEELARKIYEDGLSLDDETVVAKIEDISEGVSDMFATTAEIANMVEYHVSFFKNG
jgi:hypothetical protein